MMSESNLGAASESLQPQESFFKNLIPVATSYYLLLLLVVLLNIF